MTHRQFFSASPKFDFHTPVVDIRSINLFSSNKEVLDKQLIIQEIKAELSWGYYQLAEPPFTVIEPHDIPDVDLILIRTVAQDYQFTHSSNDIHTIYENINPIPIQKVYSINILSYGEKRDESMDCDRNWATKHLIVDNAVALRTYLINEFYIEDVIEIEEKIK
ncbi:MAG: hypothetical protein RLY40_15 [Pseudomonadota bacterium]|jgi:hypothetical protein